VELRRSRPDDARRRLELGHGELTLSVQALLERKLVLQAGQRDLSVGQDGLGHNDGQERAHDERDGEDVQHSRLPAGQDLGATAGAPPRRDQAERCTKGRTSWRGRACIRMTASRLLRARR
jgi:hypothetical protein